MINFYCMRMILYTPCLNEKDFEKQSTHISHIEKVFRNIFSEKY